MTIVRHDWWFTPVWEVQTKFDNQFNQGLLDEIDSYNNTRDHSDVENIWTCDTPHINQLNETILNIVEEQSSPFISIAQHHEEFKFFHVRGWYNYNEPGCSKKIHAHNGAKLTATYYVHVPFNGGDIELVDPRGGVDWDSEGGRKFKTITPRTGSLIFFPSFLLHSVDTNRSTEARISITTDIVSIPAMTMKLFNNLK
jgi:Rps23 Pro-64 3,4-dihydroxylase Tpa1-like proline 4-hydroxylase